MSRIDVTVPKNVLWFEVLLYLSLILDSLTAAFQSSPDDLSDTSGPAINLLNAFFILLFVFLVGLAARQRQNWARMVLLAALILSAVSLVGELSQNGLQFGTLVELLSAALTAAGLYLSFTGDAKGWFNA